MKIKQIPEDFVVTELGGPDLSDTGMFSVYRLTKRGIGTIEAAGVIARSLHCGRDAVSFGGLKDRHAATEQFISVRNGPKEDIQFNSFNLKHLGQAKEPVKPADFDANGFLIQIRDLSEAEASLVVERFRAAAETGVPNYFDHQRFGSVRGGNDFAAKYLARGDFETALKIALTSTSAEDNKDTRDKRNAISDNWNNWGECFNRLPRSTERSIVNYLRDHPNGYRKAFELIDPNLSQLYLHAYQSFLWNNVLIAMVKKACEGTELITIPYMLGEFVFPTKTTPAFEKLRGLKMALPARNAKWEDAETAEAFREELERHGFTPQSFRIKGMKTTYFHRAERKALVTPEVVTVAEPAVDELNRGRTKVEVKFALSRGSYATILIKLATRGFSKSSRYQDPAPANGDRENTEG